MTGALSRLWDVFFVGLLLFVGAVFVSAAAGPTTALNAWMLGVVAYAPLPWTPGMPTGVRRFGVWVAGIVAGVLVLALTRAVGLGGLLAWLAASATAAMSAKRLAIASRH